MAKGKKVQVKKRAAPLVYASKLSPKAIDQIIAEAKEADRGTERFADWTPELEDTLRDELVSCPDYPAIKAKVNEIVVAELGGGYFGRGPFAL